MKTSIPAIAADPQGPQDPQSPPQTAQGSKFTNILPIIQANLRKGKGQAASLLVFSLVSALLLNLGLVLMLSFGSTFEQRSEALHAPHYALLEEKRLFSQAQIDYLKSYPGVTEVESEPTVAFFTDVLYKDGKVVMYLFFLDATEQRSMNDLTLVEGTPPAAKGDVCLPYIFKVGGGYQLGDAFTIDVGDRKFSYKVCGFTEEILFGSMNYQTFQVYLSASGYDALLAEAPESEGMILRARMEDPTKSEDLYQACIKKFFFQTDIEGANSLFYQPVDWTSAKGMRTMMSDMTSIILVLFAALIVLVSLLVIRFRIRNSIEEGITNIGALKAVGYTGHQLLWATVLQFSGTALVGVVVGIAASYAVLPLVSQVLEQQTALQWQQGFDPFCSALAFASILLAVFVVAWLSARRIRTLQPLAALRQGLSTHSFKKNFFPLDRSRGSLTWLLAVKSALQAKGQMVMITLIVTAVSFVAAAGLSVYVNLGVNPDSFARLLAGEMPDAAFFIKSPDDAVGIRQTLKDDEKTRKVFYYQNFPVMIGDMQVDNTVAEDYGLFEGAMLYEGQYPRHANEVCVGGLLAEREGLKINDTVRVTQGGTTAEYLVVGLVHSANNLGRTSAMTIDGMRRIQPDYRPSDVYVYLKDNTKTAEFVSSVSTRFSGELSSSINLYELLDAQLGVYGDIFGVVAVVLLGVTVLVVFLVLYLMLRTVILRQRRELGIQKALGFTTFQLMNQFALYYIPVVAVGVAAGGLLGGFGFNSLFVALSRSMGIMTASLPAPVGLTVAMCVGLVLLAYAFALLITWRIRKVSAYALVTE